MRRIFAMFLALLLFTCACSPQAATNKTTTTSQKEGVAMTTIQLIEQTTSSTTENATTTTVTETHTTTVDVDKTTTTKKPIVTNKITATTSTTKKTTTTTQPKPQAPLRVLSIGHSFSNDAHTYLSQLAAHEGRQIECVNLFYSSCSLKKHYEFWQSNTAAYYYVENGVVDWNKKVSLLDVLPKGKWDIITIQESPPASCSIDNMLNYGEKLSMLVYRYQPNTKLFIHQTWAMANDSQYHTDKTGYSMAAMWEKLEQNYNTMSETLDLPLIPAGAAMTYLQEAYDTRGKGERVHRDGLHADLAWGCYMIALVWYRTITGEMPSNSFDGITAAYIEDAQVRQLVYDCAMRAVDTYM